MSEFRLGLLMVVTLLSMFGYLFITKYMNFKPENNGKIEQYTPYGNTGLANPLFAGEENRQQKNFLADVKQQLPPESNDSPVSKIEVETASNNNPWNTNENKKSESTSVNSNPWNDQTPEKPASVKVDLTANDKSQETIQSFETITQTPPVAMKEENPLNSWGNNSPMETKKETPTVAQTENPWNNAAPTVAATDSNPIMSFTETTQEKVEPKTEQSTSSNPVNDQWNSKSTAIPQNKQEMQTPAPVISFSQEENIVKSSEPEIKPTPAAAVPETPSTNPFAAQVEISPEPPQMQINSFQEKQPEVKAEKVDELWGPPVNIPDQPKNQLVVSTPSVSPQPFSFSDTPSAMPDNNISNPLPEPKPAFNSPVDINSPRQPEIKVAVNNGNPPKLLAVHEVQSGDNFWMIAKRYYNAGKYGLALEEYNKNRIPDPRKIKPGMKVLVPQLAELEQKLPHLAPVTKNEQESLPAGFFHDAQGHPLYRVGDSDTLSSIAQKHLGRASRWTEIQTLNENSLKDLNQMKPGLVLKLPADASNAQIASENDDFFK